MTPAARGMDFVLVLHTHLPWVLGHGRWPHGSDWLMEGTLDSYLPLLDRLDALHRDGVRAPITLGVTPVLAAQLAAPGFAHELRTFIAQRLASCDDAERELAASGESRLLPAVHYWRAHYRHAQAQFDALGGDLVGALRTLERRGEVELMSSAATHGFLPLLARDESVRLQLFAGRAEHERLFGRAPSGCWLPECAYRPRGPWAPWPSAPHAGTRAGIEEQLADAGYRFVVVDSHLARAGRPLEAYHVAAVAATGGASRSPYDDYAIGGGADAVRALVRDPASTHHVWSRDDGYPGGFAYAEFHKLRFPGGLKLWEVTGARVPLGGKQPYQPERARALAREHAGHFAALLDGVARDRGLRGGGVIVAPFDSELFGHWWHEGPDFLADSYRALHGYPAVRPVTASEHLATSGVAVPIDLPAGSWGRGGDFSMWLNPQTAWMWTRLWALEERFWRVAPSALALPHRWPVAAQAARELLLAQASDWPFIISTGEVADYGERRFRLHADATETLLAALEPGGELGGATRLAEELYARDTLFPDVLDAVARSLAGVPMPA